MTLPRNIAILCFDGIQILDVTGPAAVFAAANDAAGRAFYNVLILSAEGGLVQSNSAITLSTQAVLTIAHDSIDTLLISGGSADGMARFVANAAVKTWVLQTNQHCRRLGSICTGAFALGQFGLIDNKRVATHWSSCTELAERYPYVTVDPNALFIQDGKVWTSAGVTTGIDMCLELVAADLGNHIANAIAKRLVLYARRPGFHSQMSPILSAQSHADPQFSQLIDWIREHLAEPLNVGSLAAKVAMSERNFHRKFTDAVGETPAHFIETLRLDLARQLLATGLSFKSIAAQTGYAGTAQLAKAFERRVGIPLTHFKETQTLRDE
ncbi:AraC family transcriptional regulator [Rheinheimera sp. SA_1]|uniref:GlxA family transcriptional regulator n=1 Tax=Rheinheimera sp. SA_1 TaxID=1827365 RepID=UPI0008014178|nr:DJ-1/PfpI family protein [Rheinheimera sp. SA_1]OBP17150.1 AraC family transcriptional regulator [Rheinheimera sp. SA_1]